MPEREINYENYQHYLDEKKLMASRCQTCDQLFLPPRPMCSNCYGEEMDWHELSGEGTLSAFTAVHIAPSAMVEAGYGRANPYCVGVVQVEEGPSISAQIFGIDSSIPQEITLGTALKAAFIERGKDDQAQTFLVFEGVE